eukprot:768-Pelagococcus_subviridis.AAC.4
MKLRQYGVYHVMDALTKFRDFRRSGQGFTTPQRPFYNRRSSIPLIVQHPCFDRERGSRALRVLQATR